MSKSVLERTAVEGNSPVHCSLNSKSAVRSGFIESRCLGVQRKVGGTDLLKLNTGERPIANKYREGKMK
jgi:hypothetical protein